MHSRMKYINRWGLMRNTDSENLLEHSAECAMLAHALAVIGNTYFGAEYDVNLKDYPRLAGESDDSPRFNRAISAAPNGVLHVPKGEYDIGSMILITNRCSLSMHPAAHLVARSKMKYVIFWDSDDFFDLEALENL